MQYGKVKWNSACVITTFSTNQENSDHNDMPKILG